MKAANAGQIGILCQVDQPVFTAVASQLRDAGHTVRFFDPRSELLIEMLDIEILGGSDRDNAMHLCNQLYKLTEPQFLVLRDRLFPEIFLESMARTGLTAG